MRACCDYCGAGIASGDSDIALREYWQLAVGPVICDACLPSRADEFSESVAERLVALRLLHVRGVNLAAIDDVMVKARGVVDADQLAALAAQRNDVFELHAAGERVAAMRAGQALWHATNHLADALTSRKARRAGEKTIEGGEKGGKRQRASPKRDMILLLARKYEGDDGAKVAWLARRCSVTPQYVLKTLQKHETEAP